jgi:hypothetical protein
MNMENKRPRKTKAWVIIGIVLAAVAVIVLCVVLIPKNSIELENKALESACLRSTEFAVVDGARFLANQSIGIKCLTADDDTQGFVIINPELNIIDSFQIIEDDIYFWAAPGVFCRTDIDTQEYTLFDIAHVKQERGYKASWVTDGATLYFTQYKDDEYESQMVFADGVYACNLSDGTCAAFGSADDKMIRIDHIYDHYMFIIADCESYSDRSQSLLRLDMDSGDIAVVDNKISTQTHFAYGDYVVTSTYDEGDNGYHYTLWLENINGTHSKIVTSALKTADTYYPANDGLYYLDAAGTAYRYDYDTGDKEAIFSAEDGSYELYATPDALCAAGSKETYGNNKMAVHYSTGQLIDCGLMTPYGSGLFFFSEPEIAAYADIYRGKDTLPVTHASPHTLDGKCVILELAQGDKETPVFHLHRIDDDSLADFCAAGRQAFSASDVRYVIFIENSYTDAVGYYTDGVTEATAYYRCITYTIYDSAENCIVGVGSVTGDVPVTKKEEDPLNVRPDGETYPHDALYGDEVCL